MKHCLSGHGTVEDVLTCVVTRAQVLHPGEEGEGNFEVENFGRYPGQFSRDPGDRTLWRSC